MYWVGQKVHLGFSLRCYGKTWTNLLANPILKVQMHYLWIQSLWFGRLCVGFSSFHGVQNEARLWGQRLAGSWFPCLSSHYPARPCGGPAWSVTSHSVKLKMAPWPPRLSPHWNGQEEGTAELLKGWTGQWKETVNEGNTAMWFPSLLTILRSIFIEKKPKDCDWSAASKTWIGEKNFFSLDSILQIHKMIFFF